MGPHWKRVYFELRALFLSLALFFGCAAVHAQEGCRRPAFADSKPATTPSSLLPPTKSSAK